MKLTRGIFSDCKSSWKQLAGITYSESLAILTRKVPDVSLCKTVCNAIQMCDTIVYSSSSKNCSLYEKDAPSVPSMEPIVVMKRECLGNTSVLLLHTHTLNVETTLDS